MAVFTREAVRDNLRIRDGQRVFYLSPQDRLTPAARDWLGQEGVQILPASEAKPQTYMTLSGAVLAEKPEQMTHLRERILVPKNHPVIVWRGMLDLLQAELLLCIRQAGEQKGPAPELQQLLDFARLLMRCDVLEEPVPEQTLCGLTQQEIREHSHLPQKYYDQPHFMPSAEDSPMLLSMNRVRTLIRRCELAACEAFVSRDGEVLRQDILQAMNRMSSMMWILMIRLKKEETHGRTGQYPD